MPEAGQTGTKGGLTRGSTRVDSVPGWVHLPFGGVDVLCTDVLVR